MSGFVTGLLFTLGVIFAIVLVFLIVAVCGTKIICAIANVISSIFKKGGKWWVRLLYYC